MSTLSKNVQQATEDFDSIRDAIIEKGVEVPSSTPTSQYADKIGQIEQGITPSGAIEISENGEGIDVTQYASANVNVPAGQNLDEFISGHMAEVTTNLEVIPDFAFSSKTHLEIVNAPNANYIGKFAFSSAASAISGSGSGSSGGGEAEDGEDSENVVDETMLFNNKNLKTVNMPNVTNIDIGAFQGDENLEISALPETLVVIDNKAFKDCTKVQFTSFPEGITYIGDDALPLQENIDLSTLPSTLTYLGSGVTFEQLNAYFASFVNPDTEILDVSQIPAHWFNLKISSSITQSRSIFEGYNVGDTIIIPDGVTRIPDFLFSNICSDVTSIHFPETVVSIGSSAFRGCTSLETLELPEALTEIGSSSFEKCLALQSIQLPNAIKEIHSFAFSECKSATVITLPSELEEIGMCAFYKCESVTSLIIPDSVTYINSQAFENCRSLQELDIGNSVETISNGAFRNCMMLTSLQLPDSLRYIHSDAFYNCNSITELNISCESVEYNAFRYATSLETLSIDVSQIPSQLFSECAALESLTIGEHVEYIGNQAFYSCTNLKSIEIPDSVTTIEGAAFGNCPSVERIIMGSQLTSFSGFDLDDYSSQDGYPNLKELVISDSITGFNWDFWNKLKTSKNSLEHIVFGNGIAEIGSGLQGFTKLKTVQLGEYVNSINSWAFKNCVSLETINIPDSVTIIEDSTFMGCESLQTIILPDNLQEIRYRAFYGCSSLVSINIPESVTQIREYAFQKCSSLTSITIPPLITQIGDCVFQDCSSLTSIEIPEAVSSISVSAFMGCSSLESIVVDSNNSVYDSREDCNAIILTSENSIVCGCKTTTIPDSVERIGQNAFYGCTGLTQLYIPAQITFIGNEAFSYCKNIESIEVDGNNSHYSSPNSCNAIVITDSFSSHLIVGCTNTDLSAIPNLSVITPYAFDGSGVTTIFIPSTVESIARFSGCSDLESISVDPGNTTYDSREDCNAIIETATNTLIVGCQNTIIPNSVEIIGVESFRGIESLTSISIPESITTIQLRAFGYCTGLTSIELPSSLSELEDQAFYNSGISYVKFNPSSVALTQNYSWLFGNCPIHIIDMTAFTYENVPQPLEDSFNVVFQNVKFNDLQIQFSSQETLDAYYWDYRWESEQDKMVVV